MRNLSKTMVSEKATLIIKEINMQKIIAIIVIAMSVFANNAAQAMDVQKYILDTVPGSTAQEAAWCADAHQHGGVFMVKIHDVTLKCSLNTIIKDWDLTSD